MCRRIEMFRLHHHHHHHHTEKKKKKRETCATREKISNRVATRLEDWLSSHVLSEDDNKDGLKFLSSNHQGPRNETNAVNIVVAVMIMRSSYRWKESGHGV